MPQFCDLRNHAGTPAGRLETLLECHRNQKKAIPIPLWESQIRFSGHRTRCHSLSHTSGLSIQSFPSVSRLGTVMLEKTTRRCLRPEPKALFEMQTCAFWYSESIFGWAQPYCGKHKLPFACRNMCPISPCWRCTLPLFVDGNPHQPQAH